MSMFDTVKNWLRQVAEVGLTLIAAAVVLEIIFGSAVPFIGVSILGNITALSSQLGESRDWLALICYSSNYLAL